MQDPRANELQRNQRNSTDTQNTILTTTTRASSVMPSAKHNLGYTSTQAMEMTADEAVYRYNNTSVGIKNKDNGHEMVPQDIASDFNTEQVLEQDKALRKKMNAANGKKRKAKLKYLAIFLAVFVILAVIVSVVAGTVISADGEVEEEEEANNENEDVDDVPPPPQDPPPQDQPQIFDLESPFRGMLDFDNDIEEIFRNICEAFSPLFDDKSVCLRGSLLTCSSSSSDVIIETSNCNVCQIAGIDRCEDELLSISIESCTIPDLLSECPVDNTLNILNEEDKGEDLKLLKEFFTTCDGFDADPKRDILCLNQNIEMKCDFDNENVRTQIEASCPSNCECDDPERICPGECS